MGVGTIWPAEFWMMFDFYAVLEGFDELECSSLRTSYFHARKQERDFLSLNGAERWLKQTRLGTI